MRKIKFMVVVLVSIALLIVNTNVVLGTSEIDDVFNDDNYVEAKKEDNNNKVEKDEEEEEDDDDEDDDDELWSGLVGKNSTTNNIVNNITSNTASNTTNNSNSSSLATNRSVSNNTTLAKTGINDFGGIGAIVLTICIISAVYSLKKISEYRKM